MKDNVNKPEHYTTGGVECIDAIRAAMSPEGFQDYCKGNVMKYIWRYRHKANPLEDLKKAQVYLGWMIESVEKSDIDQQLNELVSRGVVFVDGCPGTMAVLDESPTVVENATPEEEVRTEPTPDEWMNMFPEASAWDLKAGGRAFIVVNDGKTMTVEERLDGGIHRYTCNPKEFHDKVKWS